MRCYNSSHERRGDENTVIVKLISHLMLYILLTVAAIGDFKNYRISNRLILTGLGCAFLFRLVGGKVASIIWFLPDIVFPVVILYFLYLSGILGAGDIKLFSVVCAFTNLRFTALCMAAAFVAAAGYGLISMVLKKELFVRMRDGFLYLNGILCGRFMRYRGQGKAVSFGVFRVLDDFGHRIRDIILSEMDLSRELSDEEICDLIGSVVSREARDRPMTIKDRAELERTIFNSLRKLDVLQELVDDRDVTEIMVNGPNDIFYEKAGRIQRFKGHFSSEEKLEDVIQQIVGRHNRVVNQASPIVDTRLSDGSRVNIVLNPISIGGSAVSIRKFPEHPMSMERLVEIEALSPEVARLLQILTQAKYNIFISGGTGSGKTTFLNALSQYIPDDERIITIEDSAELQLLGAKNIVRLETRNANTDGVTPITIRDLIRTALRMRPDRIIVGECRGAEALDMLQAIICTI